MTLENMFFISQTVAAFATVGALLFLGFEMRHTSRESRHRSAEESLQKLRDLELEMAADADRARVWLTGLHSFAALAPVDKVRFLLVSHMALKTTESFFLAYHEGRLARELYEPEEQHMGEFFGYAGMQAAWDIRRHYFHSAFRKWADAKVAAAKKNEGVPFLYREGTAEV